MIEYTNKGQIIYADELEIEHVVDLEPCAEDYAGRSLEAVERE